MRNLEDYKLEIVSAEFPKEEFIQEIDRMQRFLIREGVTEGVLVYGWLPFTPEDEQPKDKRILVHDLPQVVYSEAHEGHIELGLNNFWIVCEPEHICVRFCDESDIHLYSDDQKWIDALENWWADARSPIYKRRRQEGGEWGPTYVKDEHGEWKPYEQ